MNRTLRDDVRNQANFLALAVLGLALGACGQQAPSAESPSGALAFTEASALLLPVAPPVELHPSKIIGINPLVPIRADGANAEAGFRTSLDAFGLVALGDSGSCTGTHLGNGYVLTAGHCFLENSNQQTASNQSCPTVKVYWGYRGSPSTGSPKPMVVGTSQCTKVIYAELSTDRDFAIFKIDNAPKASIGIARESGRTAPGTKITIFGYPMGRPLEWSQYCSVNKSTVAGKPFNSPARMAYQCDTQPGNSGSSVIAVNTRGEAKVIGVHDAAAPDPIPYNIGTYMYDMRQTLQKIGFDLDRAVN